MASVATVLVVENMLLSSFQLPLTTFLLFCFYRDGYLCCSGKVSCKMRLRRQQYAGGEYDAGGAKGCSRRGHIVSAVVGDVQVVLFQFPLLFSFFFCAGVRKPVVLTERAVNFARGFYGRQGECTP